MDINELVGIIQEMEIPFAYDHFAEGESPNPPFLCFLLPESDNFAADGHVYFKINAVHLELYTDSKDTLLEKTIEDVLDAHEIFYEKSEVWISDERLYEVLYRFSVSAL